MATSALPPHTYLQQLAKALRFRDRDEVKAKLMMLTQARRSTH
jgi:hypothetical protein